MAALQRRFVDRETMLAAFEEELSRVGSGPRVLNVTGVGGIGKSRLLREFAERAGKRCRVASLDLQIPAHRQQEDALAVLRFQLGERDVRFDRFDIAYAVQWQRLHPHLRISRSDLPFAEHSEVLTEAIDSTAGVPVFGTAVHLLRLLEKAASSQRRRRRIKIDETLRQLDELPGADLVDAVTYLFAEDLREATTDKPYVILIDAYEALGRSATAGVWLRDLVAQLDRGLVVLASREPLGWESYDSEWSRVIRTVAIDGLPMPARLELLAESGVAVPDERQAIAHASAGVPFYLHLAVDTGRRTGAVSTEEILQRFLQHVGAEQIRFLELLSVARMFDFGIFQAVARAFQLPGHRMAWESLTSFSFIYPAGRDLFQQHQLMAAALRERLSEELARDVHRVLRTEWDNRTDSGAGDGVAALREATFHGLQAADISSEELLERADRIKAAGGSQEVAGIVADLRAYLSERDAGEDLTSTAHCLEVEAAVLLGNATRATLLTPDQDWRLDTVVGARLAVAAAHGRRIAGETAAALSIYSAIWDADRGPTRLVAGLWAADLHMAQGRFHQAIDLCGHLRERATDPLLLGDVVRLLHLAHRFAWDFAGARRYMDEAANLYERADTIIGQAAIQTNRAELFAWIDPAGAVREAAAAIEVNTDLGIMHELGKAYTALGLAHLALGDLDTATDALRQACAALEKARYRSGRARAELFRALLFARGGKADSAAAAARWAVDEFLAVQVYPTLIMMADHVLDMLDRPDGTVRAAAADARASIQPLGTVAAMEERMTSRIAAILKR
ncbi:MAG TPA: ATP-binding protein [Streptosporangiaceae bacterium]|nr:ATP-binding protein [Streptosporangiaceae bacterium]